MAFTTQLSWIAFSKSKCIASGAPQEVAKAVKAFADANTGDSVLIFDAWTSQPVEIDIRGSMSAVLKRLPVPEGGVAVSERMRQNTSRGPGRPKLGVVSREVTLLPRHWEWLASQSGGASVTLRKLVEQASRASTEADRVRQAHEAAYRFMNAVAGDEPGYEEATRALFANDFVRLKRCIARWPEDIRKHTLTLAAITASKNESVS